MRFSSQNLPKIENVSEADIERAFHGKTFGNFAHIWISDDVFLQTGCRGSFSACASPDDPLVVEHRAFIDRTGSEPWELEYIDGVARKEYRARGWWTWEQVKNAFLEYLRTGGEWRHDHVWDELDTRSNPFPNPMPDEAFERTEPIPNDVLRLEHLPPPEADAAEVWRFADTFNGFKHWGSLDRCAEIANREPGSSLTRLRTCLFWECRRWHYYGELPDRHEAPYVRGLVEKIRQIVAAGRVE